MPGSGDLSQSSQRPRRLRNLEVQKVLAEIRLLELQTDALEAKDKSFLQKIYDFITKYLGWIVALITLFGGITKPISDYLETRRKAHVISINNSIIRILDSTANIKESTLLEISSQPPDVLAPILLFNLNKGAIQPQLAKNIYVRMLELNNELSHETQSDKIIFSLFGQENARKTLLSQLNIFAQKDLRYNFPDSLDNVKFNRKVQVLEAYIDIIAEANINPSKEPSIKPLIDTFTCKCSETKMQSLPLCKYFYEQIK